MNTSSIPTSPKARVLAAAEGGRVESGAVQFGDDWPGLFLRGDDAFGLAMNLMKAYQALKGRGVEPLSAWLASAAVKSLVDQINQSVCIKPMFPDDWDERDAALDAMERTKPTIIADGETLGVNRRLTVKHLSIICHEVIRLFCAAIGDNSQPPWNEAPDWQKASSITGIRWRLDNPQAPKSGAHDSWMATKIADGWVYGEVKDTEKKTHPCIVPFELLPPEQQVKDSLFCCIIDALRPVIE